MGVIIVTCSKLREAMADDALQTLVANFREYKETGNTKGIFGRDASYNRPSSVVFAELQHVHIRDKTIRSSAWDNLRTASFNKSSNSAVVYVRGLRDHNKYLLISILNLNAHEMANKTNFMCELAEIAERFRKEY